MKMPIALAFAAVLAGNAFAQQTGVSNPPESVQDIPQVAQPAPVAAAAPAEAAPQAKPSAAEVYGEYKPYGGAPVLRPRTQQPDPDAGIVTEVVRRPNELPPGTSLHITLESAIDTVSTEPNTPLRAQLTENIQNDGRIVIPQGSIVEGRVTQVRGGKRIRGTALIHLQMDTVVLPDGTRLPLRAQVVDSDQFAHTRIDDEGNILRKDHVGGTLAAMSLATGGAAAAGGVIAGPAGALVGAGVGAGLGTVVWLKQDRQTHLPEGTQLVLSLTEPLDLSRMNFASAPAQPVPSTPMAAASPVAPSGVSETAFVPTN
ncbi:TrbI/VirB10 family protein [Terriglobus roseus]|uniref:TrbI/VirB10 family protein n=1 Tax=Terriglobus roseus TaxID=392734 RepID=A0A1G7J5R4_9BACT|nr:TrbI/VirB10 family protein [Terriglobus roseus]SDF20221.1 hypothetical protein SAMN05444167_1699 [Terriglobus roseus]